MALTPEDIEAKEFVTSLRGYDKEEVQSFLRFVAGEYREVVEQARKEGGDGPAAAGAPPAEAVRPPVPGRPDDDWLSLGDEVASVLRTAKESAESIRSRADEEARELRRTAQEEARAARQAADEEAMAILDTVRRDREAAERKAAEVLERARREGDEALERARAEGARLAEEGRSRVEQLQTAERELREKLESAEQTIRSVREQLAAGPSPNGGSAAPEGGGEMRAETPDGEPAPG